MRRIKNKWKIIQDSGLHYPEFNKSTSEDNPIWVRENINGFPTKEGAEDYISKIVILEKKKFVEARDN